MDMIFTNDLPRYISHSVFSKLEEAYSTFTNCCFFLLHIYSFDIRIHRKLSRMGMHRLGKFPFRPQNERYRLVGPKRLDSFLPYGLYIYIWFTNYVPVYICSHLSAYDGKVCESLLPSSSWVEVQFKFIALNDGVSVMRIQRFLEVVRYYFIFSVLLYFIFLAIVHQNTESSPSFCTYWKMIFVIIYIFNTIRILQHYLKGLRVRNCYWLKLQLVSNNGRIDNEWSMIMYTWVKNVICS